MMCWCDICLGDGLVSSTPFWRISINKYHSLDKLYVVPLWVLNVCGKWSQKLGLAFIDTDFQCPAFYCDDANETYHCEIIEELSKKIDDYPALAKPNCQACIRTRLQRYLGMNDYSWFDDWIIERPELSVVKYARDLRMAEEAERIIQSGS